MKKIFGTFILNAVFAFVISLGIVLQELSLALGGSMFGVAMLGLMGALGGSLLGEAINCLTTAKKISYENIGIGAVIGIAITLLITML